MRRSIRKQLTCPACGVVVAEATYRRLPPRLTVVSADGAELAPGDTSVLLRQLRAELADAGPGGEPSVRDRLEFVERHAGELIHDLRCRNGHATLRTVPQLVRAVCKTPGQWVDLG